MNWHYKGEMEKKKKSKYGFQSFPTSFHRNDSPVKQIWGLAEGALNFPSLLPASGEITSSLPWSPGQPTVCQHKQTHLHRRARRQNQTCDRSGSVSFTEMLNVQQWLTLIAPFVESPAEKVVGGGGHMWNRDQGRQRGKAKKRKFGGGRINGCVSKF